MNRVDLLTAKLLDETLTDDEWAELEGLLAADAGAEESPRAPGARRSLAWAADGVRSRGADHRRVKEATGRKDDPAVMAEIAMQSPPAWSGSRAEPARRGGVRGLSRRRLWRSRRGSCSGSGLALGKTRSGRSMAIPRVFARLTHTSGSVELLSPTGDAQPGT